MFDIGASELLVIVVVAILVIGPKDMPRAMRTAGRWIGKVRRVSAHFRTGIDAMVREAELEDMEKEWQARNARIMAQTPAGEMTPDAGAGEAEAEAAAASAEARASSTADAATTPKAEPGDMPAETNEPELPLGQQRDTG